jgi:hypothetical protein
MGSSSSAKSIGHLIKPSTYAPLEDNYPNHSAELCRWSNMLKKVQVRQKRSLNYLSKFHFQTKCLLFFETFADYSMPLLFSLLSKLSILRIWHPPLFWWDRGFDSGVHACRAGALLLEPHLWSIFFGYFGDGILQTTYPSWPLTVILPFSGCML